VPEGNDPPRRPGAAAFLAAAARHESVS